MTERRPILMFCLGGQKTSLLAKSLHQVGMSLGNDATGWKQSYLNSHCEHSEITEMMNAFNSIPPDLEAQQNVRVRLSAILKAYRIQAEAQKWKWFGIKTTAGICRNKWNDIKTTYFEEWPDAWYFSLIRKPPLTADQKNEGWNNVLPARMELAETRNAIFLPYPEVYITGEIKKFLQGIGFHWDGEIMEMFKSKRYREGKRNFAEEKTQKEYEHLIELSRRNYHNLFGETLELRGE